MKQILSLMTVLALAVMLLPGARANGVETGFDDIAGLPCETAVEALYDADPGTDGYHPGPGLRPGDGGRRKNL